MKKVIVGISGGVDSSVAALLLKKSGYEVIGITFKLTEDFNAESAVKVAKELDIKHHIIDYTKIFKEEIIDNFINDYKSGITPNPCVLCNKKIKIKFLYDQMIKFNADFIATGHYAKIIDGRLYKSSDINKDQTYFLCKVEKENLSKLLLPLEGITKQEVRKIASENNLSTATLKDSNDVCFINNTFKEYINSSVKSISGGVINIDSLDKIGRHNGLSNYTIGQRRGLNIGGMSERMYVVGKDIEKNILYVALSDNNKALISDSCIIKDLNMFTDKNINKCMAKFRYRQDENEVTIEYLDNNEALIRYNDIKSVTPGQTCALYLNDECIGGGTIKEVRKNNEKLWYL